MELNIELDDNVLILHNGDTMIKLPDYMISIESKTISTSSNEFIVAAGRPTPKKNITFVTSLGRIMTLNDEASDEVPRSGSVQPTYGGLAITIETKASRMIVSSTWCIKNSRIEASFNDM
jgi:hypothetical protein